MSNKSLISISLSKLLITDGADFIVISVEDWEQQQETLQVLQNSSLMEQISLSMATHNQNQGYYPNQEELNPLISEKCRKLRSP